MMKLFKVTCHDTDGKNNIELFIANSEQQAEQYAKDKHEEYYYSYSAEAVDNVDGWKVYVSR
jgi:hypothetical protein